MTQTRKRINVRSFDFDGCLFNDVYINFLRKYWNEHHVDPDQNKRNEFLIQANTTLINLIVQEIKEEKFNEFKVMVGSNRQCIYTDNKNAKAYDVITGRALKKGSCFPALIGLYGAFQHAIESENLDTTCEVDRVLLSDIENDQDFGTNFTAALEIPEKEENRDEYAYIHGVTSGWLFDASKLTILYAQMHKIASENKDEDADIIYDFYDDKDQDILQELKDFFNNHPDLIPKTVTLRLHHYVGGELKPIEKIQGTGKIDAHCANSINLMITCIGVQYQSHNPGLQEYYFKFPRGVPVLQLLTANNNQALDKFINVRNKRQEITQAQEQANVAENNNVKVDGNAADTSVDAIAAQASAGEKEVDKELLACLKKWEEGLQVCSKGLDEEKENTTQATASDVPAVEYDATDLDLCLEKLDDIEQKAEEAEAEAKAEAEAEDRTKLALCLQQLETTASQFQKGHSDESVSAFTQATSDLIGGLREEEEGNNNKANAPNDSIAAQTTTEGRVQIAEATETLVQKLQTYQTYKEDGDGKDNNTKGNNTDKTIIISNIIQYEQTCNKIPSSDRLKKAIAAVIIAAVGCVLGAAIGLGIGILAGSWSGPGAALTGLAGLIHGSITGAALGWALGTAATGITAGVAGGCLLFKPNKSKTTQNEEQHAPAAKP